MAELKTRQNNASVEKFLNTIDNKEKQKDSYEILEIMRSVTGQEPRMWGESIIGFGHYRYKYASGREGDWFQAGFSPRKQNLTIYLMCDLDSRPEVSPDLGKFKTGKSCLYIKRLDDIDRNVLKGLIRESIELLERESSNKAVLALVFRVFNVSPFANSDNKTVF